MTKMVGITTDGKEVELESVTTYYDVNYDIPDNHELIPTDKPQRFQIHSQGNQVGVWDFTVTPLKNNEGVVRRWRLDTDQVIEVSKMNGVEAEKIRVLEKEKRLQTAINQCIVEKGWDTLITVCDNCFTAACWQGFFMCDENVDAGITKKTIGELAQLKLEHPDYWKTDKELSEI